MPRASLQWLSLVGVIWLQSVNGTNTVFSAYSSQLKEIMSLSQIQLNNLAFASDAGKLFGFVSGLASLYLPLWLVLLIGSILGLVGYGVQYLFLTNYISSLSYGHIFLLTVLAGNSICWINTVCYIVTIKNFPIDHQVAVGLTTSYQGLSAKIYTVLVGAFFYNQPKDKRAPSYLLLNSICPLLVALMASPMIREVDTCISKSTRRGFIAIFIITIATGSFAILTSLRFISRRLSPIATAIGIVAFLLAPFVVPLVEKLRELEDGSWWPATRETKVYNFTVDVEHKRENVIEMGGIRREDQVMERKNNNSFDHSREEIGVKLMVRRLEFWLYFFVYFSGATLGLVYMNNLGQICQSRGCSGTSYLVALSSSFGFFGRLMPSLVDYFFPRSRYILTRPATIAILMAPVGGSFFLLLNPHDVSLYISTAVIGICTGAITSISVSTTTELFGTKSFSVNHNVVVANIPIGSFLFGYLASFVYHAEGQKDGTCMGIKCYRNTFIVWGSVCLFGTLLACVLYSRTRKFYLGVKIATSSIA